MHDWTGSRHGVREFDFALARHSTNAKGTVLGLNGRQLGNLVDVDYVVGQHVPHVEHGHKRLAAGKQPSIFLLGQHCHCLVHSSRIVIGEWRRFHEPGGPSIDAELGILIIALLTGLPKLCLQYASSTKRIH